MSVIIEKVDDERSKMSGRVGGGLKKTTNKFTDANSGRILTRTENYRFPTINNYAIR